MKAVLNFNVLSHPFNKGSGKEVIRSGRAVVDLADNLNKENFGATGTYAKLILSMSEYRGEIEQFLGEPMSSLGYPVFDTWIQPIERCQGYLPPISIGDLISEMCCPPMPRESYVSFPTH
jgi:hypothetical protein